MDLVRLEQEAEEIAAELEREMVQDSVWWNICQIARAMTNTIRWMF